MKIELKNLDSGFNIKEHVINGECCYLITPRLDIEWTKSNLHMRSIIIDSYGSIISHSFKKFFNFSEKPHLYPDPLQYNDWEIREKLDGSLLIISKYKEELIVRTRGTVDAKKAMANGAEIQPLLDKYRIPTLFGGNYPIGFSLLFEWVTPTNQIVFPYKQADLYLVGAIHEDGNLESQQWLDEWAADYGLKRPKSFKFNNMQEIQQTLKEVKDFEGYCLYYNKGQNIVKLKTDNYLLLHRMKSQLSSLPQLEDFYFAQPKMLKRDEFYELICQQFDYELAKQIEPNLEKLIQHRDTAIAKHAELRRYVEIECFQPEVIGRKECALLFQSGKFQKYKSFMFIILDYLEETNLGLGDTMNKPEYIKYWRRLYDVVKEETEELVKGL